jgi:hypothetical protein
MARKKGLLNKSNRRLKLGKILSEKRAKAFGYKPTKERTANAGTTSAAKATVASRKVNRTARNDKLVIKNRKQNATSKSMAAATAAGRKSAPKRARNDKLVVKNRKLNSTAKTMASATSKGRTVNAKRARNDKLVVKNRKLNTAAKSMASATMAGKAPNKSKLSRFGKIKLAAKQKALNIKGKAKSFGRKGGKMSAKHRKAISDGLKKRFGRG